MEAPVSNTIGRVERVGRVGAGSKFGWRVGTESDAVAAVGTEATTVVATVIPTVETTEVDGVGVLVSPMRVSKR